MNLAIHGLAGDVKLGNSLLADEHQTLKADFVIANPPFNQKKWGAAEVKDDARWKHGIPPDGNANYAWIQHFASHLAPDGRAGFVLANGSLTSAQSGEGAIREALIRDDLVDCVVALPGQLFYTTGIPVCLWFLDRNKASRGERDRRGEVLFIDARAMGQKISRTQIELGDEELQLIVDTYHAWRGQEGAEPTPTSPASRRASSSPTSRPPPSPSHLAATSAPRRRRRTKSPSRSAWPSSLRHSRPRWPRTSGWPAKSVRH